jgi:hypothetical protein
MVIVAVVVVVVDVIVVIVVKEFFFNYNFPKISDLICKTNTNINKNICNGCFRLHKQREIHNFVKQSESLISQIKYCPYLKKNSLFCDTIQKKMRGTKI